MAIIRTKAGKRWVEPCDTAWSSQMAMLLKLAQEYSEDLSNESKHAVTRNHKPAAIGVLYIPGKLYQKD
jgi:hypothetical protein